MFNIGWSELALILIVTLVLFGPSRLPEVAKSLGKTVKAFKEGMREAFEDTPAAPKA